MKNIEKDSQTCEPHNLKDSLIRIRLLNIFNFRFLQVVTFTVSSLLIIPNDAFAQAADQQGSLVSFLLPAVLMIAVFWFFLIRPQQKRQKTHQQMLNSITNGNKIITNGGIHAVVKKLVSGEILEVEISKGVVVKLNRQMISSVVDFNAANTRGKPMNTAKRASTGAKKKTPSKTPSSS